MVLVDTLEVTWLLLIIQVLGLVIAWMARVCEGSALQSGLQIAFLVLLALVGGVTIAAVSLAPGRWLTCGVTLALMVLMATCDFTRYRRSPVW